MPFFRVEVMDTKGKTIEIRHVELGVKSVALALNSALVNKIKREAKANGYGFRVKLEEEK